MTQYLPDLGPSHLLIALSKGYFVRRFHRSKTFWNCLSRKGISKRLLHKIPLQNFLFIRQKADATSLSSFIDRAKKNLLDQKYRIWSSGARIQRTFSVKMITRWPPLWIFQFVCWYLLRERVSMCVDFCVSRMVGKTREMSSVEWRRQRKTSQESGEKLWFRRDFWSQSPIKLFQIEDRFLCGSAQVY